MFVSEYVDTHSIKSKVRYFITNEKPKPMCTLVFYFFIREFSFIIYKYLNIVHGSQ